MITVKSLMNSTAGKKAILHRAILEAIERCERITDPAVVQKRTFAVHVRRLPAADSRGWVVRIVGEPPESPARSVETG